MQAVGVNQVQQGAHEAVDNLPSSGVSRHVKAKARIFGRSVAILSGLVTFTGGCIGADFLMNNGATRRLIDECIPKASLVGTVLLTAGVALAAHAVTTIAERVCTHPGGFIFERVCTMLDARERQAAQGNVPGRS